MVVNFRAHGINRGTRKLARTPTLIKCVGGGSRGAHKLARTSTLIKCVNPTDMLHVNFILVLSVQKMPLID
jgi:hypothetical protein